MSKAAAHPLTGAHSLLDVGERAALPFATIANAVDALVEAELIEEARR